MTPSQVEMYSIVGYSVISRVKKAAVVTLRVTRRLE